MDPIVTIALVGTARQGQVHPQTGTPVDALIEALPAGEPERKLLLDAGALAVYKLAGQQARQMITRPEPAPAETLRPCPPEVERLLSQLLSGVMATLLPEALKRLQRAGMHIPYTLLPQMLDKTSIELHTSLFPVLGARGLWLSRQRRSWHWLQNFLPPEESGLLTDAETIWQEGTRAQRTELLSRLRASDPAKALEWIQDVWDQERADVRGDFLGTLRIGLSDADEAFLEQALDDRAASVRSLAVTLLALLPNSAFAARMVERGRALLKFQKNGTLTVNPPNALEKSWQRDGILADPLEKMGKRAWWLVQVLSSIPLTFWETHLAQEPAQLLELLKGNAWEINVLDGWAHAALHYNAPHWIIPLWRWWQERFEHADRKPISDANIRQALLRRLPSPEQEDMFLALYSKRAGLPEISPEEAFEYLPTEAWSDAFGLALLRTLRAYCLNPELDFLKENLYQDPCFTYLEKVAHALPVACFDEALIPWVYTVDDSSWQFRYANQQTQSFVNIVQMRKKIEEEIL